MIHICSICNYGRADEHFTLCCEICGEDNAWSCMSCHEIMFQTAQGRQNYWDMLDKAEIHHNNTQHIPLDIV